MDPEPAGVAPAGTGNEDGHPGGSCPSRDREADPSGVFTVNDRFGDEVVGDDELECVDVQPTRKRAATTARLRATAVTTDLVCMSFPCLVWCGAVPPLATC
jgi:hypothetical protein